MTHILRLDEKYFEAIAVGTKTIECRLFDEKRQRIDLGDTIKFVLRDDPERVCDTSVVGLLRYSAFADLLKGREPECFGGISSEQILAELRTYYSEDEERKLGVLGIEIRRI
jgi:ASC-1-like (ASCH) protein